MKKECFELTGFRQQLRRSRMGNRDFILQDLLAHDRWIRALARNLVKDEDAADDLAQEAWVEALEKPPRKGGRLSSWLGGLIRNLSATHQRVEVSRRKREQAVAKPESFPSVAEMRERQKLATRVAEAVFSLEEPYRSAILYRYFENQPPREIAARLDITVAAVESRLRRGLQKLRARLDRDFGDRKTWSAALLPLTIPTAVEAAAATATSAITGALVMTTKGKLLAIVTVVAVVGGAILIGRSLTGDKKTDRHVQRPDPTRDQSNPRKHASVDVDQESIANQADPKPSTPVRPPEKVSSVLPGAQELSITGTVFGVLGLPMEGVAVRATSEEYGIRVWKSLSDRQGRYRVTGLPPGEFTVSAGDNPFDPLVDDEYPAHEWHGNRIQWIGDLSTLKRGGAGSPIPYPNLRHKIRAGSSGVDISLRFPASVAGTVIDAASGAPVTRMGFRIKGKSGRLEVVIEDPKGRFLIAFPEALDFHLTAGAKGYVESAPESVSLQQGEFKQGLVFRLVKGGALCGKVRHVTGKKIRWARIVAFDQKTGDYLGHFHGFLPEDGSFKIEGLPTSQIRIRVTAEPECPPTFFDDISTVLGGNVFQDFVLMDGGTLDLTVQNPIGRGVEGILVIIKDPKRGPVTNEGMSGDCFSRFWEDFLYESPALFIGPDLLHTDTRGKIRYELLPGRYKVMFYADGKLCGDTWIEIAEGVTTSKIVVLDVSSINPKKE